VRELRWAVGSLFAMGTAFAVTACDDLLGVRSIYFADDGAAPTTDDGAATTDADATTPEGDANVEPDARDGSHETGGGGDAKADAPVTCGDTSSDPANCGKCGHDCLGGACTAGACGPVAITTMAGTPGVLAADATYLYWVDNSVAERAGETVIYRLAKNATPPATPTTFATVSGNPVLQLVMDAPSMYAPSGNSQSDGGSTGFIDSIDLTKPPGTTPTRLVSGRPPLNGLSTDGVSLYWAEQVGAMAAPTWRVLEYSSITQAVTTVTNDNGGAYATVVAGTFLYVAQDATCIPPTPTCNKVYRCNLEDLGNCNQPQSKVENLFGDYGVVALTITDTMIFGGSPLGDLYQYHLPAGGGIAMGEEGPIPDPKGGYPLNFAADDTDLYYTVVYASGKGALLHCPLDANHVCQSARIASISPSMAKANGVVLEPNAVYWASEGDSKIYRLAR
jgi:hypothetical protein